MNKPNIKPTRRARCETIGWHPGMLVRSDCWVAPPRTADEHFAMLATVIIINNMLAGNLGRTA